MKKRQMICYGLTAAVTAVDVLGCNPFLPGVVGIFCNELPSLSMLMLAVFIGCAAFMPYVMAIKYLVVAFLIMAVQRMWKKLYGGLSPWTLAAITGACTFLCGLGGEAFDLSRYSVLIAALEAMFAGGFVLTFQRPVHKLLLEKRKLFKEVELNKEEKQYYSSSCARAIRKIADTFGTKQIAYADAPFLDLEAGEGVIAKGLNAIATALEGAESKRWYQCLDREDDIKQLEYQLSINGVQSGKYSFYEDTDGHHHLEFQVIGRENQTMTMRTLAKIAGDIFGMPFAPRDDCGIFVNKAMQRVVLTEQGRFRVRFQVAKQHRDGGEVCGDNFSVLRPKTGKVLLTLSDGIGFGQTACRQSERVLELVEELVEVGFEVADALPMMNSCFSSTCADGFCATLDLCEVDEFTGQVNFYKMGARASFVLRKNHVDIVECESLPAGAFSQEEIPSIPKRLYDGDYIIMVSDGILDGLDENHPEEVMTQLLMQLPKGNPGAMAANILEVVKQAGGTCKDDCMVMVAGIWKR